MRIFQSWAVLILAAFQIGPAVASEAFVTQSLGRKRSSDDGRAVATNNIMNAKIASPLPMTVFKPTSQGSTGNSIGNISNVAQYGTGNFAVVSQAGSANQSAVMQHGSGNVAIVNQRSH